MADKFYITTPIYYVNDSPHIGHTCTTIFADILARYNRLIGKDTFFLTGTDEHGLKIAQSAEKKGLDPKEFCDKIVPRFKKIWQKLNISNDYFIRTTNPKHEKIVQDFIQKLYDNGDIYKDTYEGLYCIGCEKFLTESDLDKQGKCPLHPADQTIQQKETNWFFKLSKYVPKLIELIENDETNYVYPQGRRREILSKLKSGVEDISISRTNLDWGVSVPWDKSQTIYVWVDALINYYSATRFLKNKSHFWPTDVHLLAKDILWFHTVIWQAMLLSLNVDLPKKVFIHSYYIMSQRKISKSLGNIIKPEELIDNFGVDGTRYLIAATLPLKNDTDISIKQFKDKYNADLANGFGNLVSRTAKLIQKKGFKFKKDYQPKINPEVKEAMANLNPPKALKFLWGKVHKVNKEFTDHKIWELEEEKFEQEISNIIEQILEINHQLKAFVPQTAQEVTNIFLNNQEISKPLFPRV